MKYVKFEQNNPACLDQIQFPFEIAHDILIGPPIFCEPNLIGSVAPYIRNFILRERQAAEPILKAPSDYPAFISQLASSHRHVSIFEKRESFFVGWLGLTSRPTHIVIPKAEAVIYDLQPAACQTAWDSCMNPPTGSLGPGRIGVVPMPMNFGHQIMNNLSGLQRLIDTGAHQQFDEFWIVGKEFFGDTQKLFPEIANKIRRMSYDEVKTGYGKVHKIGANIFPRSLRNRILRRALQKFSPEILNADPVIAFSVRNDGRRCLNLVEVVSKIVSHFLPRYPRLGVILDGWCLPDSPLPDAIFTTNSALIGTEVALCRQVMAELPSTLPVKVLVGTSILKAISSLQCIDAYVSHVGTPQHKLGWFTQAGGVVHGPTVSLDKLDSGTFATESGVTPYFLSKQGVIDHPNDGPRGPSFYDYRISDIDDIIARLEAVLEGAVYDSAANSRQDHV
ncbi:conserved protein of unknown function [Rhodovastum atsumiense]|uniref:Uncharacterized protein n=1 Tax=Rhodovastum atsumiense TaxID=504468 RepID=A0A5M6ILZ1_9PROT|nr:hypothetical protein [Rhodovastum atsumiense]KAA5608585.1 hypothetical protein F1189_28300 [Rhodovastum atsumiense]CAH2603419.1 conserved protein of unknown function [Rhodovastum atsumiense]